jgi:hypothetical protein
MIVHTRLIRYCNRSLAADALRLGWLPWATFVGCHHGEYSPGMVAWVCSCPAPWPKASHEDDYTPSAPVDHQTEMTP